MFHLKQRRSTLAERVVISIEEHVRWFKQRRMADRRQRRYGLLMLLVVVLGSAFQVTLSVRIHRDLFRIRAARAEIEQVRRQLLLGCPAPGQSL